MRNKTQIIIVLLLLGYNLASSQEAIAYSPDDLEQTKEYLKNINAKLLERIDSPYESKIKKIFKKGDEKVVKQIRDSAYLFNNLLDNYLDKILDNIYSNNELIDNNDYKFFIRNSIEPNASCYGNGMFEVYLGLLDTLESDDELAFVICHEIAHKILDHPLKNVTQAVEKINSKEIKQRIRTAKTKEYGRTRAALSIVDELNIDYLTHSKKVEAEADSLGFIIYKNTNYNQALAISSLQRLEKDEDVLLSYNIKIDSVFNFKEYPFKSFWIKDEVSLFDIDEKVNDYKLNSDTLKTHPEIPFRINKLIEEFNIDTTSFVSEKRRDEKIEQVVQEKSIEIFIDTKQLDIALYQLEKKHSENKIEVKYYTEKMLSILETLYFARKKHEIGKYIALENNLSKEKEINIIRKFLHRLELREIRELGKHFYLRNKQYISSQEAGKYKLFLN